MVCVFSCLLDNFGPDPHRIACFVFDNNILIAMLVIIPREIYILFIQTKKKPNHHRKSLVTNKNLHAQTYHNHISSGYQTYHTQKKLK